MVKMIDVKTAKDLADTFLADPVLNRVVKVILDKVPTVEVPQWISMVERFPEIDSVVLACDAEFGDIHTARFNGHYWYDGGWLLDGDAFTHWMPLPEPPEGR